MLSQSSCWCRFRWIKFRHFYFFFLYIIFSEWNIFIFKSNKLRFNVVITSNLIFLICDVNFISIRAIYLHSLCVSILLKRLPTYHLLFVCYIYLDCIVLLLLSSFRCYFLCGVIYLVDLVDLVSFCLFPLVLSWIGI